MTEEAMKLIRLGMECESSDLDEPMMAAFSALFVAACKLLEGEFRVWNAGTEEINPDAVSMDDITAVLTEFHKAEKGDVQGAPV